MTSLKIVSLLGKRSNKRDQSKDSDNEEEDDLMARAQRNMK